MRLRSHRPRLPLELIAYIIDYIDSPVALKNCSRVCHAWLPLSRPHIFRVVAILLNGRGVFKRLQRLNDVLEQSPCISIYVSELCITRLQVARMAPSEYPKLSAIIPSLLYKLTNLRKIAVSRMNWTKETTPEIRLAVRALVDRPSLVHIRVFYSKFAKLDHLTALLPPTLKRLDICSIQGTESGGIIDEENKRLPPQKPCQLEYLECEISPSIADWLLNSQQCDISNIHTLDVRSIQDESESISRIVRRLGSSLEHLRMTYSYSWHSATSYGSIDFSCNPNIKSISFSGRLLTESLPPFTTLMSSLVATNIEQVRFACQFHGLQPSGIWEELDRILQDDRFTMLREVELRVLGIADESMFDVVCQSLPIHLPRLHARGILRFSFRRNKWDYLMQW